MTIRLGETQTTFKAPAHLMDPSRTVVAWFTDPPGIFIQFARRAVFSLPLAQWMAGPMCAALTKRYPAPQPIVLILDLTRMDGRDPQVRPIIVDASRAFASRTRRAVVVPPHDASRVYLASVTAAASLARLFGLTVAVESLSDAVRSLSQATPDV